METATKTLKTKCLPFSKPAVKQYNCSVSNANGNRCKIVYNTKNTRHENPKTSMSNIEERPNKTENCDDKSNNIILLRMLSSKLNEMDENMRKRNQELQDVKMETMKAIKHGSKRSNNAVKEVKKLSKPRGNKKANLDSGKHKWTDKECVKFVKMLLKATQCSDISELKDRKITTADLTKLSKEYPSDVQCLKRKWSCSIYPRLYLKEDCIPLNCIKEKIIDVLIERNYGNFKTINWQEVMKEIDGFTATGLYRMFLTMLYREVPTSFHNSLQESLRYMKKAVSMKSKKPNQFLIRKLFLK